MPISAQYFHLLNSPLHENVRIIMIRHKKIQYASIFDAIPYFGGSKVASISFLNQLKKENINIEVFSQDKPSWEKTGFNTSTFSEYTYLINKEYGLTFYLKNTLLALRYLSHLLGLIITYRRLPSFIIGISGPGIDFSMFIVAKLLKIKTIQLVHGPIGESRLSKYLLHSTDIIGFLPSERKQVLDLLEIKTHKEKIKPKLIEIENGLEIQSWPKESQSLFAYPEIFWSASLLKWKKLDLLLDALEQAVKKRAMHACITYIKPNKTLHSMCNKPKNNTYTETYETPENLGSLRSQCNIFVSTSICEPFGLSILEALAAGLCVVIPEDGAYWDKKLIHGYNCIKYTPNSRKSLEDALLYLADNMPLAKLVAEKGLKVSERYHAEDTYQSLVLASKTLNIFPQKYSSEFVK